VQSLQKRAGIGRTDLSVAALDGSSDVLENRNGSDAALRDVLVNQARYTMAL
jgi:hypothetical protein